MQKNPVILHMVTGFFVLSTACVRQ